MYLVHWRLPMLFSRFKPISGIFNLLCSAPTMFFPLLGVLQLCYLLFLQESHLLHLGDKPQKVICQLQNILFCEPPRTKVLGWYNFECMFANLTYWRKTDKAFWKYLMFYVYFILFIGKKSRQFSQNCSYGN